MTTFVGLDLAWTANHETGVCVLAEQDGGVVLHKLHTSIATPECFGAMCGAYGDDVVVAVDAPLVVKPERRAEAELGRVYGSRHAGAYSANMAFLENMKGLAGPQLAQLLFATGFHFDPAHLTVRSRGRFALEAFPHPAHVELFVLPMALKYKKGRVTGRREALVGYQAHLANLLAVELPLVAGAPEVRAVLSSAAVQAKGRALKNLEDRLDALTCAYIAYHCWRYGPAGFAVFGCHDHGCIVVPRRIPQGAAT